eukprot:PhF_6_TR9964/c0_g1_i2/m.15137
MMTVALHDSHRALSLSKVLARSSFRCRWGMYTPMMAIGNEVWRRVRRFESEVSMCHSRCIRGVVRTDRYWLVPLPVLLDSQVRLVFPILCSYEGRYVSLRNSTSYVREADSLAMAVRDSRDAPPFLMFAAATVITFLVSIVVSLLSPDV